MTTTHRSLAAILADLDCPPTPYGTGDEFYRELELAVRAEQGRAPKMAPPRPDFTVNVGYTIRAVLPGHPAGDGLLESWYVAAECDGDWVTWNAYRRDGGQAGLLSYDAGHYFNERDDAANKRDALADLAVRAGLMSGVGLRIADEIVRYHETDALASGRAEDRRMARRLRWWCTR